MDSKIRDELVEVLQAQIASFDQMKIAMADDEIKAKAQFDKMKLSLDNLEEVKKSMDIRYAKMAEWIEELKKQ